jgi:hypothetical protein
VDEKTNEDFIFKMKSTHLQEGNSRRCLWEHCEIWADIHLKLPGQPTGMAAPHGLRLDFPHDNPPFVRRLYALEPTRGWSGLAQKRLGRTHLEVEFV